MPLYESTFIARPDISSQQVDGLAEQLREILTEAGGEVAKTEYWGLRSLAYRIKKNRKGHYYFMNIDAPPEAIEAMEHTLRINEDVIRYLTVRVEEHDPNPAPLTQSRGRGRDPAPLDAMGAMGAADAADGGRAAAAKAGAGRTAANAGNVMSPVSAKTPRRRTPHRQMRALSPARPPQSAMR